MKLIEITNQHRRDFTGKYKCEECGFEVIEGGGYDDSYFHNNVIPAMKCDKCGKSTIDIGAPIEPRTPKYLPFEVV